MLLFHFWAFLYFIFHFWELQQLIFIFHFQFIPLWMMFHLPSWPLLCIFHFQFSPLWMMFHLPFWHLPRSSLKTSRATKVHNLSEEVIEYDCVIIWCPWIFFGSYIVWIFFWFFFYVWISEGQVGINEKLKTLQNIIPKTNKVHQKFPSYFFSFRSDLFS